ncbi:restriction endonuclease subunit S, partial [Thiohalocapsa marina]|uniref:restriction endonuclease subunit S n=1 Tax=Thiohalocapsa marina TaxID=424902 RepID=UPI0036D83540
MLDKKKNKGIPHPYLGNSNVRWGAFDLADLAEMKFEESEYERYGLQAGDLIVCEGGEPGRCAVWQDEAPDMKIQKALHRIRPKRGLNNYYLYYWFMLSARTGGLEPYFTGTTIKHLTGKALNELQLRLPPDGYQQAAVKVLRSLDDKIQLNHQINQTLEQMAQAIFKSWFVDFEPVKAKIAALDAGGTEEDALLAAMQVISGRSLYDADASAAGATDQLAQMQAEQPEQYAELRAAAELFPSAMQDSELGEIPEGWEVAPFAELARLDTSSVKPGNAPNKQWEHYSIPAFDDGKSPVLELGAEIKSNKYKVHPAGVLSSKLNPHFPRTWWPDVAEVDAAICSTEFMQFVPRVPAHRPFVAGMVTSAPFQSGIMMRVTGSTGSRQRAQPKQVAVMEVVLPTTELVVKFSKLAEPLYQAQARNIKQSQGLAGLRDTLLPKLLSGELTLLDTEAPSSSDSTSPRMYGLGHRSGHLPKQSTKGGQAQRRPPAAAPARCLVDGAALVHIWSAPRCKSEIAVEQKKEKLRP